MTKRTKGKVKRMAKKLTPEQFYALSRRERAVLIAKDILERLRRNKLAVKSNYGYVVGIAPTRIPKSHERVAAALEKSCTVCALGACFISAIRLGNQYRVTSDIFERADRRELMKLLRRTFSTAQAREIEAAFERRWWREDSDSELLARIMEHIVRNNGSFKAKQFAREEEAREGEV